LITLLTPTRDRPEAFRLCVKWMQRQTYVGAVQWIIVDDSNETTSLEVPGMADLMSRWDVAYVRRNPSDIVCTLQDNLLVAIPKIGSEKVIFAEDDEWYAPGYVAAMAVLLDEAELVGECGARYFNVKSRRWWKPNNQKHASLCRTAIRSSMLPVLAEACKSSKEANDVFVDLRLWGVVNGGSRPPSSKLVSSKLSVGIKGMPGRGGAGKSHTPDAFPNFDPDLRVLREWIGEDAQEYAKFVDGRMRKP